MPSEFKITAGKVADIEAVRRNATLLDDWIFVDIGFAPEDASCGVAVGNRKSEKVSFAKLVEMVVEEVGKLGKPLNLLLEDPLSMAFTKAGNPWPRSFEAKPKKWNLVPKWFEDLKDGTHRGWYRQAGTLTKAGAERLIWKLCRCKRQREVRLFEGSASLKADHHKVAEKLREVVKGEIGCPIVSPNEITAGRKYTDLWPITGIEGWDSHKPPKDGIPPVVWVPPMCKGVVHGNEVGQCCCTILRNQVP